MADLRFELIETEDGFAGACPVCGRARISAEEQESYYSESQTDVPDKDRDVVELCSDCRFEAEVDAGEDFEESGELPDRLFLFLKNWATLRSLDVDARYEQEFARVSPGEQLAKLYDAELHDTGGGIWNVIKRRRNGSLVVLSPDSICVYADQSDYDIGRAQVHIDMES